MSKSVLEATLERDMRAVKLPPWEREYRFAAEHVGLGDGIRKRLKAAGLRDWRLDFAWTDYWISVEVNGGTWIQGRHNRGSSIGDDYEKINAAQLLGWSVYQFTSDQVTSGRALAFIEPMLRGL